MILSWFYSWWRGYPRRASALDLFVWRAWRSGPARWAFLGLLFTVLLAGSALALLPPADSVPITLPSAPLAIAVDDHASRLYVATADHRVWVLNSANQRVIGSVNLGGQPVAVAADSGSGRAYAATTRGLTVLAADALMLRSTIDLGQLPTALTVDPALHRVYVATMAFDHDPESGSLANGSVVALDTVTDAIVGRVIVGVNPQRLAVDPHSHRVYVVVAGDGSVDVLGGASLALQASIPIGRAPYGIGVDPNAGQVYISNYDAGSVTVLDEATNRIRATVPVGPLPAGVAVDPVTRRIFVANGGEGTVAVLRGPGAMPLATLNVGGQPDTLAVGASGGRLYVTDVAGGSLWLLQDHRFGLPTARLFARAARPETLPRFQQPPG